MPRTLLKLLILFFALQVVSLQLIPLWGSSEAREAHVVWEVANAAEGIVLPTRAGIIPSKPPLFHWVSGAVHSVFSGIPPLAVARFISLIGSIVFLIFSFRIGKLFGDHHGYTPIIVLTSWLFLGQSADAKVDMFFSAFVVGSLCFGAEMIMERRFLIGKWLSGVLLLIAGVLCKGPLAVGLVGLLLSVLIVATKEGDTLKAIFLRLVLLTISLCIVGIAASVWYLLAADIGGNAFVSRQLLFENLHRIIGHEKMNNQPWWFYIPSLLRTTFPWSGALLALLLLPQYRQKLGKAEKTAFGIFLVGVLALSIASGKRHSYPLPLLPFMAAGIAVQLSLYFTQRTVNRYGYIVMCILAISACIGLSIKGHRKGYDIAARQIISASAGKKITILKDQFDESLDPVMYFLREHLAQVNKLAGAKDNACLISVSDNRYHELKKKNKEKPESFLELRDEYLIIPCAVIANATA